MTDKEMRQLDIIINNGFFESTGSRELRLSDEQKEYI